MGILRWCEENTCNKNGKSEEHAKKGKIIRCNSGLLIRSFILKAAVMWPFVVSHPGPVRYSYCHRCVNTEGKGVSQLFSKEN